jgi:hypothetical protein
MSEIEFERDPYYIVTASSAERARAFFDCPEAAVKIAGVGDGGRLTYWTRNLSRGIR